MNFGNQWRIRFWAKSALVASFFALVLASCAPAATPAPAARQAPKPPAAPAPAAAPQPAVAPAPAPAPSKVASIKLTKHPQLGPMLTDAAGRSLYLFTRDELGKSNCSGGCAQAWPPLTTSDAPIAGEGLNKDFLKTITRADGSMQVTYNGYPLYYWFQDDQPGDANGQNVNRVWYVVSSYGGPIQSNAPVKLAKNDQLGTVLADASGRTLYLYAKDERNKSNCSGGCAMAWPPMLTADTPTMGEGIAANYVGTIKRADGTMQVTYNGYPLYYWNKDVKAGDATGQNVGNVWFTVSTFGGPIMTNAPLKAIKNDQLGAFITDASGRSLYLYTRDEKNKTNCAGDCAMRWPPLLTTGKPAAGEGLTASLIGTITRPEGGTQVTYNGWPLYYWYLDDKPGDTKGQNVGRVWYVVSPTGDAIKPAAPSTQILQPSQQGTP